MSGPYQVTVEKAAKYDQKLRADDPRFNRTTVVQHEDGSHFLFMNAFACKHRIDDPSFGPQEFIIVFTEHFGTHVYSSDEVSVMSIGNSRGQHPIEPLEPE